MSLWLVLPKGWSVVVRILVCQFLLFALPVTAVTGKEFQCLVVLSYLCVFLKF